MKRIGKYIIKGFLVIIPLGITMYIIKSISDWILSQSRVFLFYIPDEQLKNHQEWYILAVFTTFFLLWFIGFVAEKTLFGKRLDAWMDKTLSNMKGIGGIYSFANKLTEVFGSEQQNAGKPVVMPFLNATMQQVGYITNKEKVLMYHPTYQKEVYHYIVNFAPAFALMGGTVVFVPEELIQEYNDKYVCKFTVDEAFQFNISGGSLLPGKFINQNPK